MKINKLFWIVSKSFFLKLIQLFSLCLDFIIVINFFFTIYKVVFPPMPKSLHHDLPIVI